MVVLAFDTCIISSELLKVIESKKETSLKPGARWPTN